MRTRSHSPAGKTRSEDNRSVRERGNECAPAQDEYKHWQQGREMKRKEKKEKERSNCEEKKGRMVNQQSLKMGGWTQI